MSLTVHISGKDNETLDYMPEHKNESTEWRLSPIIFQRILEVFYCKLAIDLFTSCINYRIDHYASWHPERNGIAIDSFSISCLKLNLYAFPPFSLIGAAVAKFRQEQFWGIIIIPWWKTQFWFAMMVPLLKISGYFFLQISEVDLGPLQHPRWNSL